MENTNDLKNKFKILLSKEDLVWEDINFFVKQHSDLDLNKEFNDSYDEKIRKYILDLNHNEAVASILEEDNSNYSKILLVKSEIILKNFDVLLENESKLFIASATLLIASVSIKLDEILIVDLYLIRNVSILVSILLFISIGVTLFFRNKVKVKYIKDLDFVIKQQASLRDVKILKLDIVNGFNSKVKESFKNDFISHLKKSFE